MNIYECQDFFKENYPNKNITYEFDHKCMRQIEMILTDSAPNLLHHVQCNRVKVTVEGESPKYVPIQPHRYNITWTGFKELVNNRNDVFIHDEDLEAILKAQEDADSTTEKSVIDHLKEHSGLQDQKILDKIVAYKAKKSAK